MSAMRDEVAEATVESVLMCMDCYGSPCVEQENAVDETLPGRTYTVIMDSTFNRVSRFSHRYGNSGDMPERSSAEIFYVHVPRPSDLPAIEVAFAQNREFLFEGRLLTVKSNSRVVAGGVPVMLRGQFDPSMEA
jgi:hypothetical protein